MADVKGKIESLRAKRAGVPRPIAERMARLVEGEKTFVAARQEILDYLKGQGWELSGALKIPHATSPGGDLRLWFKAQAVYYTEGHHTFGDARALSYDLDIRKLDGASFLKLLQRWFPNAGLSL